MLVHRGSRHRRLRNTSSKQFVVGHERRYHVPTRSVGGTPPATRRRGRHRHLIAGIIGQLDFESIA